MDFFSGFIGWRLNCIMNLCYLLFVYVSDMSEVLIVSDPGAMGWMPPDYRGWRVRTVASSGGRLPALTGLAVRSMRPETRVVVMVPPLRFEVLDRVFSSTASRVAPAAVRVSIGGPVKHYLQCGLRTEHLIKHTEYLMSSG